MEPHSNAVSTISQVVDLLHGESSDYPVTHHILADLTGAFIGRVHGLSSRAGLAPPTMAEFRLIISVLFAQTLSSLNARPCI
jgi:hypothetical protein